MANLQAQPEKLPSVFAVDGDAVNIPASNDGTAGLASFSLGFPEITEQPLAQGGLPPQRTDFNGLFKRISAFLVYAQQGGVYEYDSTENYGPNAFVKYNNTFYMSLQENGPATSAGEHPPTDTTYWDLLVPGSIVSDVTANEGVLKVTKKDGSSQNYNIGRVTNVTEAGGIVTVTKEDGTQNTFTVITSVNNDGGSSGNVNVSSGVIGGDISNLNAWWIKFGGTIPLIIQGALNVAVPKNGGYHFNYPIALETDPISILVTGRSIASPLGNQAYSNIDCYIDYGSSGVLAGASCVVFGT